MPNEEKARSDRASSFEDDEMATELGGLASQERRKRRRCIISPRGNAEDNSFEQLRITSSSTSDKESGLYDSKENKDKGASQTDEGKRAKNPRVVSSEVRQPLDCGRLN